MSPLRLLPPAALGLAATLAFTVPALARDIRTLEQVYTLDKATAVRIELGAGEVRIEPSADRKLRASMTLKCSGWDGGCERRARSAELVGGYEDGRFLLKLEGMPRMNNHRLHVDAVLQVPRDLDFGLALGAGEVNVHDLERNVHVDLGAGDVNVFMRNERVGSVSLAVGLGDARIRRPGHDINGHGWLSKALDWSEGPGSSRVSINVGVGDAEVALK